MSILLIFMPWQALAEGDVNKLTTQEFRDIVKSELVREGVGDSISIVLFGNYPPVMYENAKPFTTTVKITNLDSDMGRFHGDAFIHDKETGAMLGKKFDVDGRFDELAKVPVLKRRMTDSETISEQDVDWLEVNSRRINNETVAKLEDIVGKSPRRVISSGRMIQFGDLDTPILVNRGETVVVTYRNGALSLSLKAMALEIGRKGDSIQLRNKDSGRGFMATVTGKGQLEVTPALANRQHAMANSRVLEN